MPTLSDLNAVLPQGTVALREIAHGGQRIAYEAQSAGQRVCLKLMRCRDGGLERAEREVAVGYGMQHPNLVEIFDSAVCRIRLSGRNYCYFREEFIDGPVLTGSMGGWTVCDVLALMRDLLSAVDALWTEHRVVHRDITPRNVIRHPSRGFVLLDLGYGRHQGLSPLTHSNVLRGPGTAGYLSPEQLVAQDAADLDHRSDQFQIGILSYEATTGVLPFAPSDANYVRNLQQGAYNLGLAPIDLHDLLNRLLAAHPHRRPRTPARALRRVEQLGGQLGCS